eukprot:Pgem_evm1s17600
MESLFARGACGYVPQVNSLFPGATVAQHMEFACNAKGLDIKSEACQEHIDAITIVLGLDKHLNKRSKTLSGGYKRKLCLAIAVVGSPEVLFLDEITTGMDPGSRHSLWNILRPKNKNVELPSILLSTHYLDEAVRLAHSIGIVIDGEMVAAGDLNRLTDKYCKYNVIQISLDSSISEMEKNEIIEVILASLPKDSYVSESLLKKLTLKVPRNPEISTSKELGQLFELLESLKVSQTGLKNCYYSVAKMSLEQIFMELCQKQFSLN